MAVLGVRTVKRNLRRVQRAANAAVAQGLDDAAEELRRRARLVAPQLSGDLIESFEIAKRDQPSAGRFARAVYSDSPYAIVRHEDFYNLGPVSSAKTGTDDGPIGRKYLTRPLENNRERFNRGIAREVEFAIRRAVR